MENEPLQRCDNCLKDFPQSKMATHFGYCRRNIKKCTECNQFYDINFKDQHEQQYHRQQACPHCKKSFLPDQFKAHQKTCTQKPKYCEYCDLNVPVNTYPTHLKACEARTKPCTKCNLPITNKDYYFHIVSCDGPKEEPKPTRNYQQHIQQQRRVIQQNNQYIQKVNSREKIFAPSNQPRNVQVRDYAPNQEKKNVQQPKVLTYNPPPRPQPKLQEKKQYMRPQQPLQAPVKRDQIRKPSTVVNPPPTTFTYGNSKKEDPKPIGRLVTPNTGSSIPSSHGSLSSNNYANRNDYINKGTGSRQPIKPTTRSKQQQQLSSKEIYPKNGGVGVKQSKSIERKYVQPAVTKKEQKPANLDSAQTVYPQRIKAPQTKQRVIYQDKYPEPKNQQQDIQPSYTPHQAFGVGVQDDPELQMAIMQSLGQGGKNGFFQVQSLDESFINKQKAIQAQLKNKKRR